MKSRQVGFVLMALIVVGLAGIIVRVVSSGSDKLMLEGLLPLTSDVIERVVLSAPDSEAELRRVGDTWTVNRLAIFPPKLDDFWIAVSDMEGAQLIAINSANHERMRVAEGQGTTVSFYLGQAIQEEIVIGPPTEDVQLCYVRRAGKDEVFGIPCLRPDIFDPDPDGWRDPIIAAMPPREIESVAFTYPDEEFDLKVDTGEWLVSFGDEVQPANLFQVDSLLRTLQVLVSSGFASEEETEGLNFPEPDAALRIATFDGAPTPARSLRIIRRDDTSFFVRTFPEPTVFILDGQTADGLLKTLADFLGESQGE